jgi:uncharacterized OB-fold protein
VTAPAARPVRVPVREGLFSGSLDDLDGLRLVGSRCEGCGEVQLATVPLCANCGGDAITTTRLSREGTLWTYTVLRYPPPGARRVAEPYVPTPTGLVELADGVRVLAPLSVAEDDLEIGMSLRLRAFALYVDDQDREVVAFEFGADGGAA